MAAGVVVLAAALTRLLTLPLPAPLLAVDCAVAVLAAAFVAVAFRLSQQRWFGASAMLVLYALTPALLAALALRLAAAYLPGYPAVTAAVFAVLLLCVDTTARPSAAVAASVAVLAVFSALWLTTQPLDGTGLATYGMVFGLLAGVFLLTLRQGMRRTRLTDEEVVRGRVYAVVSRRLGTVRDLTGVTAGILEACHDLFPFTTYGSLQLLDETDGLLKPASLHLEADGPIAGGPALELVPSEGLAGAAFSAHEPLVWPTAIDVSAAEATLREVNRARLRLAAPRFARCAAGMPLRRGDGDAVGSVVLTSHRRENAWSEDDIPVLAALAEEAGRAVERARGHAADVDRALLDSITGLVSHRQLVNVIGKEVSRAARAEERVAVIFSDLDSFKQINDAWGHDTGNRVLRIFADVLRSTLRREDTAARYGGDEFVCVLPGAERAQAVAIAERIRQRFAEVALAGPMGATTASVSSGVAVFPDDAGDPESLLAAADAELLRVKQRRAAERQLTGTAQRPPVPR
ncbi:MAG TPA: sensor domain-containing diguanylate cyclase [Dehalococcoidia bacterium]|nr:sensor domain-containing diguanylate cyclase [Dehalococcoidia bacterium]